MKKLLTGLLFIIGFVAVFLVSSLIAFNSFPAQEPTEAVEELPATGQVSVYQPEETGDGIYTIVTPSLDKSKTVVKYGSREDAVPVNRSQSVSVDIETFYTPEVVVEAEKKADTEEDDKKTETLKTEEKKTENEKKEEAKKEETKKEETKTEEKAEDKVEQPKEEEKVEETPKAEETPKVEEKPEVELDPDKQYSDTGL